MSIRDKLGLYGPNKPQWTDDVYTAIQRSGVRWVVWRTNADSTAPTKLAAMGINVIAQAPDLFNSNPHAQPWVDPIRLYSMVRTHCPAGTPVVFDNEPNLHPHGATTWHAEQWTRYARAHMAVWRWLDPAGDYPLILPALAPGPDRNGALWHTVQQENLYEANGVGLHAYWQTPDQLSDPLYGAPWLDLIDDRDMPPFYILEYGNTTPVGNHRDHLEEYAHWLRGLHKKVRCACLFILDPTPDWQDYTVTEPVLDWLANLKD